MFRCQRVKGKGVGGGGSARGGCTGIAAIFVILDMYLFLS